MHLTMHWRRIFGKPRMDAVCQQHEVAVTGSEVEGDKRVGTAISLRQRQLCMQGFAPLRSAVVATQQLGEFGVTEASQLAGERRQKHHSDTKTEMNKTDRMEGVWAFGGLIPMQVLTCMWLIPRCTTANSTHLHCKRCGRPVK